MENFIIIAKFLSRFNFLTPKIMKVQNWSYTLEEKLKIYQKLEEQWSYFPLLFSMKLRQLLRAKDGHLFVGFAVLNSDSLRNYKLISLKGWRDA